MKLAQKAFLVLAIPFVFEIACGGVVAYLLHQIEEDRQQEVFARDLSFHFGQVMSKILDRGTVSFQRQLGDDPGAARRLASSSENIWAEVEVIKTLVRDHPKEKETIEWIVEQRKQIDDNYEAAKKRGELKGAAGLTQWRVMRNRLLSMLRKMQAVIDQADETQQQKKRNQSNMRFAIEVMLLILLAFDVLVAAILAQYFYRQVVKRMSVLIDNTRRIATGETLNAPLAGNDEITELDTFFANMQMAINQSRSAEQSIIDNAVDVICVVNENSCLARMNEAAYSNWGYETAELLGQLVDVLIVEEDRSQFLEALRLSEQDPSANVTVENRVRKKDGNLSQMRWSLSYSPEEKSVFCIAHDINAQKETDQLRRDFVGMVSHDLKTPLTSLVITHEFFSSGAYGDLTDEGMEKLSIASRNAAQLLLLVENVLDVEKLEAGQLDIKQESVPVDYIFATAVKTIFRFSETEDTMVRLPLASGLVAIGDREKLVKVAANLISYALNIGDEHKYITTLVHTNGKSARLSVQVYPRKPGTTESEELTVDRALAAEDSINISLSRSIVKSMNGEFGTELQENGSLLFWFSIPLATAEQQAESLV